MWAIDEWHGPMYFVPRDCSTTPTEALHYSGTRLRNARGWAPSLF